MPSRSTASTRGPTRTTLSTSEYSVCTRRWTNVPLLIVESERSEIGVRALFATAVGEAWGEVFLQTRRGPSGIGVRARFSPIGRLGPEWQVAVGRCVRHERRRAEKGV